ncbi:hypothetical protein HNO89_000717 [Sporosarcina luteola]|nr:hypothetical protein [Sporosarcina luteola]
MAYKRLISYGGLLKEIHKKLQLGDAEDGDLILIDEVADEAANGTLVVMSGWHVGLNHYRKQVVLMNIEEGVYEVSKYKKRTLNISIVTLAFFLTLSLIMQQWGFFLWSLLPVFIVLMTTFSTNFNRKSSAE